MSAIMAALSLNNAWANATLWEACRALPEAEYRAARPSFFGSIAATLAHIWAVDRYYLDALEEGGRGRAVYDDPVPETAAALAAAQAECDLRLARFCRGLDAATLAATRATERAEGVVRERVEALLLHLFQHQIHHRGQVHALLSQAGVAPPQLDEFFLDHDRAGTARAYLEA